MSETHQVVARHNLHPSVQAELKSEVLTIVFLDVVESVRLIEQDEAWNVRRIRELLNFFAEIVVQRYEGHVAESRGDGLIITFEYPRNAAAFALACQEHLCGQLATRPADTLAVRIGIHTASVISDKKAIYGQGMNLTARIAGLAKVGETLASIETRSLLTQDIDANFVDLGDCYVKNRLEPIRVFRLEPRIAPNAFTHRSAVLQPSDPRLTLAVIPMKCGAATADPNRIDAGDVIAGVIADVFSQSAVVKVISQMSSRPLRDLALSPQNIRALLGVDYLVQGTVAQTGVEALKISIELVQARSGAVVWRSQFEGRSESIVHAESNLMAPVLANLADALSGVVLRSARYLALPNLETHALFLGAISMMHKFSHREFERSKRMLDEVIERTPRHPLPIAWLARWHVFRVVQSWSDNSKSDSLRAMDLSNRALDIDPRSSVALTIAGSVAIGVKMDVSEAIRRYEQAIAVNPSEALAWLLRGVAHGFRGEAEAAMDDCAAAIRLSPIDPMRFYFDSLSASAALGARKYDFVAERASRAICANRMHGSAYRALAIAQWMTDQRDAATETIAHLLAVEPTSTVSQFQSRAAFDSELNRRHAAALRSAGLPTGD